MNTFEIGGRLIAGILLILMNAYFVAIEFGLTRARQYPKAAFDTPALRRAWEMTDDLELYLTTCQIWISGTSIALGIIAEPGLTAVFEPIFHGSFLASAGAGSFLAFFLINMVHLTHGEQTPTYLGVERSKQVCRYAAPLYWFAKSIAPLIRFGDWVAKQTLGLFGVEMTGAWLETEADVIESRADLRHRLGSLLDRGDLSDERRDEVLNAFTVGERSVSEIMTDREEIVFLSTVESVEENLTRIGNSPHTRFPLIGEEPTDFRGIVYVPAVVDRIDDLKREAATFEEIGTPPMTIQKDLSISDAIDQFQSEQQELALVRDENEDEIVGLITATDALEAVMGEIEDPLDIERQQRTTTSR